MDIENYVISKVDGLIANHQYTHNSAVPKEIKMNSENAEVLKESIRKISNLQEDAEVTQLRGTKISIDDKLEHDEFIVISE
jgi:flagellar hook-basal body complex protein FliE